MDQNQESVHLDGHFKVLDLEQKLKTLSTTAVADQPGDTVVQITNILPAWDACEGGAKLVLGLADPLPMSSEVAVRFGEVKVPATHQTAVMLRCEGKTVPCANCEGFICCKYACSAALPKSADRRCHSH